MARFSRMKLSGIPDMKVYVKQWGRGDYRSFIQDLDLEAVYMYRKAIKFGGEFDFETVGRKKGANFLLDQKK